MSSYVPSGFTFQSLIYAYTSRLSTDIVGYYWCTSMISRLSTDIVGYYWCTSMISSTDLIARTKSDLETRFEMADSGKCAFVLGIELVDIPDGSVAMYQRHYVDDILKRFDMEECKVVASPVDIGSRLLSRDS